MVRNPSALISSTIKILLLQKAPAHFAQVAQWHHQECERQGLTSSFAVRQQRLLAHVQEATSIPKTIIAVSGSQLLGCVSLVDYSYRSDESVLIPVNSAPVWLSNLYVPEPRRRLGIGNLLVEAAKKYALQLQLQELWLSATEYTDYYEKRGWQITRRTRLGGRQVNIMRISLSEAGWQHASNG